MMTARILLVEDEAVVSIVTSMLLEDEGYLVEKAYDGAAGLDVARKWPPDLVITDYMMPRMDGLTMIAMLRQQRSDVPIILMTSIPEADLPRGYTHQHDAFVLKPYRDDELLDAVRRLLKR